MLEDSLKVVVGIELKALVNQVSSFLLVITCKSVRLSLLEVLQALVTVPILQFLKVELHYRKRWFVRLILDWQPLKRVDYLLHDFSCGMDSQTVKE